MPKNAVKLAPQPKTKSTDFALIDATRFVGGSGLVLGGSGLDWELLVNFILFVWSFMMCLHAKHVSLSLDVAPLPCYADSRRLLVAYRLPALL